MSLNCVTMNRDSFCVWWLIFIYFSLLLWCVMSLDCVMVCHESWVFHDFCVLSYPWVTIVSGYICCMFLSLYLHQFYVSLSYPLKSTHFYTYISIIYIYICTHISIIYIYISIIYQELSEVDICRKKSFQKCYFK